MKTLFTLALLIFIFNNSFSQGLCGMASDEPPGCVMCGPVAIFSTAPYSPGLPGPTFPCGTIENNAWLSFIAGSTNVSAILLATNCQNGRGVQLLIYDQDLNPVSTCFSSTGFHELVTASGLIPGEVYWIMVDGFAGDVCDVELTLTGGVYNDLPDPPGSLIPGSVDQEYCIGDIDTFYIEKVKGATFYGWDIPSFAQIISLDKNLVVLEFNDYGIGEVCVQVGNTCNPAFPPECIPITSGLPLPINLPIEKKCEDEFPFYIDNTLITGSGSYTFVYDIQTGCDSVVIFNFEMIQNGTLTIDTTICQGNPIDFYGHTFGSSGSFQDFILGPAENACDSILNLKLNVIGSPLNFPHQQFLNCFPNPLLTLNTNNLNLPPGSTFNWVAINGGNIVSGANTLSPVVDAEGDYIININLNGTQSCSGSDTIHVSTRTPPSIPVFDSIHTSNCVLDSGYYSISPLADADTIFWYFEGYDTMITTSSNALSFPWNGRGGIYNLKVQGKNLCGFGPLVDTMLTLKPLANPDLVRTLPQQFCMDFNLQYNWNGSNFPIDSMVWDLDGGHFTSNHNPPQSNIIQWDSPGIKFVSLVLKDEGCESVPFRDTLQVDSFLDKPIINCTTTSSSVEFNWQNVPGATGYSVNVLTGQSGIQGQNTYLLNGLSANEIVMVRVQAFGNTSCGSASDTLTCTAMDCPNIFLEITAPTAICPGTNSVPLTFLQTGGQGNGTAIWSGPGVTGSEFLPQTLAPGIFTIELTYEEIGCLYNESIQIEIKDEEIASFDVIEDVCIHQSFVISFDGAADPSSTFNWNFDGATVDSGFGMGPYTVSFDNPGTYQPSLEIISNAGCFSNIFTKEITVHDELSAPVIQCSNVSNSSITFEWNAIAGSNGYEISIDGGTPFNTLQNEYTLNGLDPAQQVSIEVRGISPWSCFAPSTNLTCETLNCPNLSINISPVNAICENETGLVTLNATVSPNVLGTGIWSGPNVSPNGILNLSGFPVGSNTITYEYSYLGCDYQATSNIMVTAAPDVNGSILTPVFYTIGTSGAINLNPVGNGPFDFQWSDGSFSQDRDSLRSGIYCVTVSDDNDCFTDTCYSLDFGIFRISPVHIVCRGSSKILSIRPARGADFQWSPATGLSCTDCPNPIASPNETTEYTLTATLPNGRSESVKILVVVIPPPFCPTAREVMLLEEIMEDQLKSGLFIPKEDIIAKEIQEWLKDQNEIIVFPNPTDGNLTVKSGEKLIRILVRDVLGRIVLEIPASDKEIILNIESLTEGAYLLDIFSEKGRSKTWISKTK